MPMNGYVVWDRPNSETLRGRRVHREDTAPAGFQPKIASPEVLGEHQD